MVKCYFGEKRLFCFDGLANPSPYPKRVFLGYSNGHFASSKIWPLRGYLWLKRFQRLLWPKYWHEPKNYHCYFILIFDGLSTGVSSLTLFWLGTKFEGEGIQTPHQWEVGSSHRGGCWPDLFQWFLWLLSQQWTSQDAYTEHTEYLVYSLPICFYIPVMTTKWF